MATIEWTQRRARGQDAYVKVPQKEFDSLQADEFADIMVFRGAAGRIVAP